MSLLIQQDIPELPDREIWEAPRRLTRDEARDHVGSARDRNPKGRWDAGEEDDQ